MKKNFDYRKIGFAFTAVAPIILASAAGIAAQNPQTNATYESEDFTWWYASLLVLFIALGGAIAWLLKNKKAEKENAVTRPAAKQKKENWDAGSVDADKEMEWLRKNQKILDKKRKSNAVKKKQQATTAEPAPSAETAEPSTDAGPLPVFSFQEVEPAKPFDPLPISNDEALLSAIEQTHDEYEEDEEVRELAVRILTAFKTRNSVEALAQVALYDLSSGLRSKAVLTLTEFDHESVFETILLSCADPTREVRAAAARGLTRLNFDRADAWARIAESGEIGRTRQAARAAVESGFVERAFDRLVHPDRQYSYEAFVLLSLLVQAGETEPIFAALKTHKDIRVRLAIVHLLKVTKDKNALNELFSLLEDKKLPQELRAGIDKAIEEIALVAA